ncbi:hypothetical protein RHMOL_Rhmol04G0015700 [Rhododendron molle]|uniref:Uncharacterized protein n=1 Tax=Rhododendron molle TaxID=49168 RepID=A0ACC0NY97_RHOML|nr:hypothetical protein RHMOL_Rhmol04G0015700 [Rhododendron molle]
MHGQLVEILNTGLVLRSLFQSDSSIVQWTIRGHILSRSLLELEGEYVLVLFGLLNVELPFAHLLFHFDWKFANGTKNEDVDMTGVFAISS